MKNTPIALCFLALALCAACGGGGIPSHSGALTLPIYNASDWYKARPVPGRPGMLMLKDGSIIVAPPNYSVGASARLAPIRGGMVLRRHRAPTPGSSGVCIRHPVKIRKPDISLCHRTVVLR